MCSISLSWSHRFLLSMGLSYKSSTGQSTCMHTPQQKETNIRLLKLRLCWSRHEHSVPPNRVFNIDETALRLLPLPTRSWQRAGERPVVLSHRAFTTCTLVCSADPAVPLAAQLMFEGKTDRVLPVTAAKENRHVCRNEKHWASQETVFTFLQYITNGCAPHDCIVILDMAPVHYAKSLCDRVRAELSTCHLLYVPRGATSYAQPLDISYMRGFKAEVAQFASQALAADLLQDADVRGMIRKLPKVRNQLVDLVDKALLNMDNGALHDANLLLENAPSSPMNWSLRPRRLRQWRKMPNGIQRREKQRLQSPRLQAQNRCGWSHQSTTQLWRQPPLPVFPLPVRASAALCQRLPRCGSCLLNPFWLLDTCSFAVGIGCNRGILALDTMAFEPASRTYHCFKCRGEFTPTDMYRVFQS